MTVLQTDGLSHSEIRASRDICSYTRLIAAYHVLHRLCEPRHPPYALTYFRLKLPTYIYIMLKTQRTRTSGSPYFKLYYLNLHKGRKGNRNSISIFTSHKNLSSSLQSCLCQHVKDRWLRNTRPRVGFRIGCAYPVLTLTWRITDSNR